MEMRVRGTPRGHSRPGGADQAGPDGQPGGRRVLSGAGAQGRGKPRGPDLVGAGRCWEGAGSVTVKKPAWQQDATAFKMQAAPVWRLHFWERRAERENHFQGYRWGGVRWEGLARAEVK